MIMAFKIELLKVICLSLHEAYRLFELQYRQLSSRRELLYRFSCN